MTAPALGYFWGDDGYGLERAADRLADRLAVESGMPAERRRLTGAEATTSRLEELVATAPLFGGGTVVTIVDPAPLLRSQAGIDALIALLDRVAPGNGLVILDPRTDLARKGKDGEPKLPPLPAAVRGAGGEVAELRAPTEGRLAAWIEARAAERNVRLGRGSAQELARRVGGFVREGDVDRRRMGLLAVGELEKLALLRPTGEVTVDDVRELVPEVIPASSWAFLDAVATRRAEKAAELLPGILDALPEPVLIAILHRRLRELIEIADRIASGAAPAALVRAMKLNPYRAEILAGQARRWTVDELVAALDGIAELDARLKGVPPASDAQRRLGFALWLSERVAQAPPPDRRTEMAVRDRGRA